MVRHDHAPVEVPARMPEHRHGMNYRPSLTPQGPGRWRADGLLWHMAGQDHQWWREGLVRQFGGVPSTPDHRKITYDSEAGAKALAALSVEVPSASLPRPRSITLSRRSSTSPSRVPSASSSHTSPTIHGSG